MTLDELSVVFSADIAPFSAAVGQLSQLISAAGSQADGLAARMESAGALAGDGLKTGLLSRRSAVAQAAKALADAAASALRAALDIHSPSRLTYQVGAFFDEGLLRGIAGSASQVEKEAAALGQGAASALTVPEISAPIAPAAPAFSSAAPADAPASAPLSLTVPLEIDGYRLGVAAIEGINRVARGTGRVELTL